MKSIRFFCLAACLLLAAHSARGASTDGTSGATSWPHLRGPGLDGRASAAADLGESPALALAWRVPLGSGYSGIAAANGLAVTLFSDGTSDVAGAFDLATGKEIWRHPLDSVNKARDGSDDGPLSTPLIAADRVFVVGAKGQLVALALADGAVLWQKKLQDEFGSVAPHFGFSTSPILAAGKLIVMTGGPEGRAISALDPETGTTVWSAGAETVEDQMPIAMELAGRQQIVAVAGKKLRGMNPEDGTVLWTHEFGENDWVGSSTPTYAGENQFLVMASGEAVVFSVGQTDNVFAVSELYRSKTLGQTFALPVYHDGYLYGFRGQALSCMNAGNGERAWRSRPPGGRGLILVDDKLIIFGAAGNVVVAEASPEGYRERARVQALEASSYSWPAYADGRVLVRNLEEMAAVELTGAGGSASEGALAEASTEKAKSPEHAFGAWIASLTDAEDKNAAIAAYLESHPTSPILEDRFAHFIFEGEAEDLAITGTMLATKNAAAMARLDGTNFYYKTVEVEPGGRFEYRLIHDYGESMPDPRNPDQVPSSWGPPMSQFVTSGYEAPQHIAAPTGGSRGRVEEPAFESKALGKRELKVYLPPGYDQSADRYPLLLVHDGLDWLEKGLMVNSLDNLIGRSVRPVVVAFLKPAEKWWLEAGGTGTDQHVDMLVGELVPFLSERYRLTETPASHASMGTMGYGLTSAYLALKHPGLFGKAAIQSPQIGLGYEDAVRELMATGAAKRVTFYLDWNRHEIRDVDAGFDLYQESRSFAQALESNNIAFVGGEMNDSSGWAGWRARTDRILEALFPMPR